MTPQNVRLLSLIATCVSIALGALGLLLGFFYLTMKSQADIMAGQSAFVAGAVLISGGIIALAVLATSKTRIGND